MKPNAMVVCPQPEAAETGIEILERGGNAVDAAIACALAQGVVDPLMCGIAGFGSAAVYLPGQGVHRYLDFHAPAPAAAREDMWEDLVRGETRDGFGFILEGRVNDLGYQSIAVPTALKAYETLHRAHGRLPWKTLFEPAVAWAQDGFFVRPAMHTFFMEGAKMGRAATAERLAYSADGRALYCRPDGTPKEIGAPLANPDYAVTLQRIAEAGADTFYGGDIAATIAADMASHGGLLSQEDLASYRPRWSEPLTASYRGRRITTNQPPGGGVMLIEMLNILEHFDLRALGHNSPDYVRIVCEAMKRATIDKDRYVGDPDFVTIPLDQMTDKAHAGAMADEIKRGVRASVPRLKRNDHESVNTTHLCVVDGEGGHVLMTHSLGMPSGVITEGLGFFYNGCMGVFDPRPGRVGSIAPGKSRFSAMCPTIVFEDDQPVLALGAPGGTQIVMGVLQTILNVFDFGMDIREAVAAPRFSSTGDSIDVSNRIPRSVTRALEADGYEVIRNPYGHTIGWVHAIRMTRGEIVGAADPGRDGVAYAASIST
ncbi:MAG: gamma-glutamyltransferase [Aurantimonas endophytica]|uniref:Glutathione hydrolase proenzyme n=1 Tax=Aurantimonas endophytica TaxID=1522175 RepID=A0A7W6MQW6_9HYPH|nr:gamma-glutamyltransferase [Aurantimonas endophytica]MBB4004427.1 gamma-glutamyltranspeptidase/glutathione hydrolase [Aurantimonas endophytica]MCO6405265.1 gamma-glutamyltransferase [Aurantimonas endophytica]